MAMALATVAVLPVLGSPRRHRGARADEWIYFGHVRLWEAGELAARLSRLTPHDEVRALSAQLVRMSRLNWRKHRLLQGSILLTVSAMVLMVAAAAIRIGD